MKSYTLIFFLLFLDVCGSNHPYYGTGTEAEKERTEFNETTSFSRKVLVGPQSFSTDWETRLNSNTSLKIFWVHSGTIKLIFHVSNRKKSTSITHLQFTLVWCCENSWILNENFFPHFMLLWSHYTQIRLLNDVHLTYWNQIHSFTTYNVI